MIIVGKQYTVDNLHTLTGTLSPRVMSERSNDQVYVCGGIYSDANAITNWGICPNKISYMGKQFSTSEAAYFYKQAVFAGDLESADLIHVAPDAYTANRLGRKIKELNVQQWNKIKYNVMTAKFTQNPTLAADLKSTGKKVIGEAGKHPFYATGVPVNHKDALDPSKWNKNGNMLGKILVNIRDNILK